MAISDHTENNQKPSECIRVNHGNHETLNNLLQVIVSVICVIHMSANTESQMLKTSSLQTLVGSVGWSSDTDRWYLELLIYSLQSIPETYKSQNDSKIWANYSFNEQQCAPTFNTHRRVHGATKAEVRHSGADWWRPCWAGKFSLPHLFNKAC